MIQTATDVIRLLRGKTLATAESCTGGMVGAALTAVSGASEVYKGGVVSYCNEVKAGLLNVPEEMLTQYGAVSAPVAAAMAEGAAKALQADIAVSTTGLAGPSGDDFGNPVGRVYIGYHDEKGTVTREFTFSGDREVVRRQATQEALKLILEQNE